MSKDYKHRVQLNKATGSNKPRPKLQQRQNPIGALKWMLVTGLVIGFAVFLLYLRSMGAKQTTASHGQSLTASELAKLEAAKKQVDAAKKKADNQPKPPSFDFYTILPKKEVVVADHEIKTRSREERVGKSKGSHYVIQAGSFKSTREAEHLRAKLALMGLESKTHKAKVGDVVWYRVKIGPYARSESVSTVMARLQQHEMKPVVTEIENLE
jgi:cell division protein FtsN